MTLVVNLVRTVSSAKFICCCRRNHWCDCHVTHTPKCNESAKIRANHQLWLNNTDCLCFPSAAYELRQSSDLALLTKWPVFLQNTFGNPAHVNQTNLNGKLRKKLGGPNGGSSKHLRGPWPTQPPPLESPLLMFPLLFCISLCVCFSGVNFFVKACCVKCCLWVLPYRSLDIITRTVWMPWACTSRFAALAFMFGGHSQLTRPSTRRWKFLRFAKYAISFLFPCPGCRRANDGARPIRRSYLYNFLGRVKCEWSLHVASDFFRGSCCIHSMLYLKIVLCRVIFAPPPPLRIPGDGPDCSKRYCD